jgi:hypothetical protein
MVVDLLGDIGSLVLRNIMLDNWGVKGHDVVNLFHNSKMLIREKTNKIHMYDANYLEEDEVKLNHFSIFLLFP